MESAQGLISPMRCLYVSVYFRYLEKKAGLKDWTWPLEGVSVKTCRTHSDYGAKREEKSVPGGAQGRWAM